MNTESGSLEFVIATWGFVGVPPQTDQRHRLDGGKCVSMTPIVEAKRLYAKGDFCTALLYRYVSCLSVFEGS